MRGFLLSVMVGCLVWAGCGEPQSGGEVLRLQTDWLAQPEHGGFYQAAEMGLYAEAGIEVAVLEGGPNALIMEKLASGRVDFAIGRSDDVMLARAQGLDFKIVAAFMQHDPQALMLHASNPIDSFADLDGQRVMAAPGQAWVPLIEGKFDIELELLPLDFGTERFMADPAFIQQVFLTSEPFYVRQHGVQPKLLLLRETGFDPYRVIYTTDRLIAERPEAVRAFVEVSLAGWHAYMQTPGTEAHAAIAERNPKKTPEFIAYVREAMREHQLVYGSAEAGEALGQVRPE
ncbi:MAG: ABC transporter substrate-binding protein, partial [Verrucomicrobiota bacterium]